MELTGRVVRPDDPGYDAARRNYNERFDVRPALVVFCQSVEDVRAALGFAREQGMPLRVRGGWHSYEAFSLVEGGLVLDVSDLHAVRVSPDRRTADVGAGAQLIQLYQRLGQLGLTLPGGTCPTVGIAGLTLGGGFGLTSRRYGLTCDCLEEAELVSASGEVLVASAGQHPELFWALRGGGGGNFGVVTRFRFRVFPLEDVAVYTAAWDFERMGEVLEAWQEWAPPADPRLTSVLKLYGPRHARPGPVTSTGQFVGPLGELRRVLEPFVRRVPPHQLRLERKAFLEAVDFFGGDPEPDWSVHFHGDHKKFKNTSAFAYEPLPAEALETLCAWMEKAPTGEDLVQLENFGGKVADLAPHATAFFHRRAQFFLQYQAYWSDDSAAEDHLSWVRGVRDALTPYTRGAYVNYTDADLEDWPERYYGDNYPRLQEVKQQYDPEDFFHFPQSIRLPGAVDGR